jgi:hypothetical protein
MKKEDDFLKEIERRLAENRRLVERSILPERLAGVASYLGFHTLSVLLGVSLGLTLVSYGLFYERLMLLGRVLFLLK